MPNDTPPAIVIDEGKQYRVTVARSIQVGKSGQSFLRPISDNRVSGKLLKTLLNSPDKDAVTGYEAI